MTATETISYVMHVRNKSASEFLYWPSAGVTPDICQRNMRNAITRQKETRNDALVVLGMARVRVMVESLIPIDGDWRSLENRPTEQR